MADRRHDPTFRPRVLARDPVSVIDPTWVIDRASVIDRMWVIDQGWELVRVRVIVPALAIVR